MRRRIAASEDGDLWPSSRTARPRMGACALSMSRRRSKRVDDASTTRDRGFGGDRWRTGRSRSIRSPRSCALQGNPVSEKNAHLRSLQASLPIQAQKALSQVHFARHSDLRLPRYESGQSCRHLSSPPRARGTGRTWRQTLWRRRSEPRCHPPTMSVQTIPLAGSTADTRIGVSNRSPLQEFPRRGREGDRSH